MNIAFLETLTSPDGNALAYEADQQKLIDEQTKEVFDIQNGVPVLLPKDAGERSVEVTLSNGVRAKFFYLDHYQQDAEVFDYFEGFQHSAARHENRRLHEMILRKIPKNARTILDVGCGSAWVAKSFLDKNVSVFSMDISLTNPTKALQRYVFEQHFALVADVYALPFKPDTFDCIIAAEVMEHTPDPRLFLSNLLQVLKPGGTLIVTTPFDEQIPHSLCVHCNRATPHNAHLHSFNAKNVSELLAEQPVLNWKMDTFANKFLVKLQTHWLLQYLPFGWWKIVDKFANLLFRKPLRLLLAIKKS